MNQPSPLAAEDLLESAANAHAVRPPPIDRLIDRGLRLRRRRRWLQAAGVGGVVAAVVAASAAIGVAVSGSSTDRTTSPSPTTPGTARRRSRRSAARRHERRRGRRAVGVDDTAGSDAEIRITRLPMNTVVGTWTPRIVFGEEVELHAGLLRIGNGPSFHPQALEITFTDEGTWHGTDGCNVISGSYVRGAGDELEMDMSGGSTQIGCAESPTAAIAHAVASAHLIPAHAISTP